MANQQMVLVLKDDAKLAQPKLLVMLSMALIAQSVKVATLIGSMARARTIRMEEILRASTHLRRVAETLISTILAMLLQRQQKACRQVRVHH
jgi:tellurite resistance protein